MIRKQVLTKLYIQPALKILIQTTKQLFTQFKLFEFMS